MPNTKTCLGCPDHEVIIDSDPDDWFNDDDQAVICTLVKDPKCDPNSKYRSDRNEFMKVARSCRPYNLSNESEIPGWCPKKAKQPK